MNLTYAYGHSSLSTDTSNPCNFSWMGGTMTSTDKLKISFYGLTTMRADFLRFMDKILSNFRYAYAFLDNQPTHRKGIEIAQIAILEKILKELNRGNMASNLLKM